MFIEFHNSCSQFSPVSLSLCVLYLFTQIVCLNVWFLTCFVLFLGKDMGGSKPHRQRNKVLWWQWSHWRLWHWHPGKTVWCVYINDTVIWWGFLLNLHALLKYRFWYCVVDWLIVCLSFVGLFLRCAFQVRWLK